MRYSMLGTFTALLAGCQAGASFTFDSAAYRIPSGSEVVLNREINIPAGSAHVKLQHGQLASSVSEYEVNCEFRVRDLGPRLVPPGSFIVTRSGDSREWAISPYTVRFFKTVTLEPAQDTGRVYLMCQKWDDVYGGRSISIAEMQEALGDYFSLGSGQTPP